jgi:hypothetical protein
VQQQQHSYAPVFNRQANAIQKQGQLAGLQMEVDYALGMMHVELSSMYTRRCMTTSKELCEEVTPLVTHPLGSELGMAFLRGHMVTCLVTQERLAFKQY